MVFHQIMNILRVCDGPSPLFPPTELYNEGWLLRLFLDWFSANQFENHPLCFSEGAKWFSEALLPSAFLPRSRKDSLGESWTHADGVIGHFAIGSTGKGDLSLLPDATHFVVLEAKMFSKLSSGVTHARYFDQAARNVACIAEVLKRANCAADKMSKLGFYVLAPQNQINKGDFEKQISKESILSKVKQRVEEYNGDRDDWFHRWFQPTLKKIDIRCLSWEELLWDIQSRDPNSAKEIKEFYELCLKFNAPQPKSSDLG